MSCPLVSIRRSVVFVLALFFCVAGFGQAVLPYTISTVAGQGAATSAGAACFAGSPLKATDTFGDGCPARTALFSSDIRGGIATDPQGNVYIADTSNSLVRRVEARSGLIRVFAGGNKVCTAALDKDGDGCVATTNTLLNSPRGVGSDPYGNILIAGYSDNLVHLVCNAVSPLCTAAQIGTMRVAAGCYTTATAYGSAGNTGDGLTAAGACGATVATVNQPRGATADRFGNIYFGDTGNSRFRVVAGPVIAGVTNPLIAILQLNPANSGLTAASAAGKVYALAGGTQFTAPTAAGAACFAGSSSLALDTYGDGCPFYTTSVTTSGGFIQGVATDAFGDFIFTDSQSVGRIRVIFAGGTNNPMARFITLNNPTVTAPQPGYAYSIAGGGAVAASATPVLASTASLDGNLFRVSTDPQGNLYVGDNTSILFLDIATGSLRRIAANNTVCAGANAAGDGCPAQQASFGGSSNVLGLALDNLGNLFFADGTNHSIREISASSFAPAAFGSTSSPSLFLHAPAGTASIGTTLAPGSDFALGTPACMTNAFDATYDCTIPVTFTPSAVGPRDAPLTLTLAPGGATQTIALTATALGAGLTFDPTASPSTQKLGTSVPAAVAVDGRGNTYAVDSATLRINQVAPTTQTPLAGPLAAAPRQLAVDTAGSLYAAVTGSANISKYTFSSPASYVAGTLTNAAIASAGAVTVDANGNLYVADATSGAVIQWSQSTGVTTTLTATGLGNPTGVALDHLGNLLVIDAASKALYRVPVTGVASGLPPTVTLPAGTAPVAVAADGAGDVFVADASTGSVLMIPVSGANATVASGFSNINGLAVDDAGNVYVSAAGSAGVTEVLRSQFTNAFGSSLTNTLNGTLTNAGNATASGFAQTDTTDFQIAGTGATCNLAVTAVLPGTACTVVANFSPSGAGAGQVTDAISFLPAASSSGALTLTGVKSGSLTTTTTTIMGETPAAPVYVAGGASVSFSVAVVASSGTAAGYIMAALDGGAPATYTLNGSGVAMVALTGLKAGSHTLTANFPSQGGVSGSTATAFVFSVAQASTAVTWAPAATTLQYSQALGTAVLNATANGIPGAFVYMAKPASGAALQVDAATYLPVGTYSLSVAFTPADATDYMSSNANVASLTITKANTSAALGTSTNVVAADGSGNYTSLASAVAALPVTGGTIYLAPGTYSGQVNISYPNVALRGLGGNAQKVVITAENGAFSAPYPAGVTAASNGFQGDQGSSTMVVDKQTIGGTTYIPNGFYMENLSIQNTYDTDATNSNTLATVNGVCTAGQPANNNFALYNAGTLCASQALALWIRSDQAVLNNVRLTSLQDTLYAGSQGCGTTCIAARQYFWNGYITGDVDYIFGDAATVFDGTTFYTTYHGLTATGTETIEAQNKARQTGSAGDYLSGYILNKANLTSQSAGMTQLYFGRPYGQYSTYVMLNTTVDQVNPVGWIEFSGDSNLPSSTYAEYNTMGPGGTAASLAGRETISLRPEQLTAAQAAQYAPVAFLSTPSPDIWNPSDALTAGVNGFVPANAVTTIGVGKSITILARPQTPGGGAIPTGTYTLSDGQTTLATGTLDASGEAYLTTSTLTPGPHSITLTYGGDANFNGSTSSAPLLLTVSGTTSALTITTANPTYGAPVNVTVAVTQSDKTHPLTGSVNLVVDANAAVTAPVTAGVASFMLPSLAAGAHKLTAQYSGDASNGASASTTNITVAQAVLTVTANAQTAVFGTPIPAYTASYTGLVNGDTAASLSGAPALMTTPAVPAAVGTYVITASTGTLVAPNYSLNFVNGVLTITQAKTTTTLATNNAMPGAGTATTFTATVVSTLKGTPTGAVSFFNGTTLLSSIALPASGIATYTTTFAAAGSASITAVYSGDASFSGSSSSATAETIVAPALGVTANPATLTVKQGAMGTVMMTFTPTGNYQGSATLSCMGLPRHTTCSLQPVVVNFTGDNSVQSAQLTLQTDVANAALLVPERPSRHTPGGSSYALLLLPGLSAMFAMRKRLRTQLGGVVLFTLLAAALIGGASGCGTDNSTPTGMSTVTVVVNAAGPSGATMQQVSLNLTITQ